MEALRNHHLLFMIVKIMDVIHVLMLYMSANVEGVIVVTVLNMTAGATVVGVVETVAEEKGGRALRDLSIRGGLVEGEVVVPPRTAHPVGGSSCTPFLARVSIFILVFMARRVK